MKDAELVPLIQQLLQKVEELDRKVSLLARTSSWETKVPLKLRDAAEVCHVEYLWLRERVMRREIPAYRSTTAGAWRVFPADVKALVMQECNLKPARRKSILEGLGRGPSR